MKTFGITAIMAIFIFVTACNEDEETITPSTVVILSTDNSTYIHLDNIIFTIYNETPNSVNHGICQNSFDFDYEIEKKEGNQWVSLDTITCSGFSWTELSANSTNSDTVSANLLDEGDYRIKMKFIIESNNTALYSNLFNVK